MPSVLFSGVVEGLRARLVWGNGRRSKDYRTPALENAYASAAEEDSMSTISARPSLLALALIALPVLAMTLSVASAVACAVVSEVVTSVVRTALGA
jgi:hypothetical protein